MADTPPPGPERVSRDRARQPGSGDQPTPRTDVLAIAALVMGIVGGCALSIPLGFASLGRIRRSGGTLTGAGMAVTGIVLGFVWAVIGVGFVVVLAFAAPDNAHENVAEFPAGEKREIAALFDRVEQALEDGDAHELCDDILTEEYVEALSTGPRSCREIATADGGRDLVIRSVDVHGTVATAVVDQGGETLDFVLVKLGADGQPAQSGIWRVNGGSL